MGKEQLKIETLELKDMSGGLNSNPLSTKFADNEATDCQNVVWKDHAVCKIPGLSLYLSVVGGSESTSRITGIFDFQKRDGTQTLIVTSADDILTFNAAPGTSIKGALTVSDALHQFVSFNDRLIGTNYTNAPWAWSGAGNAVTLASLCGADLPPAQAKLVATFNSRVCFGNYIDNAGAHRPTAVAFSGLDDSAQYDLTNQYWEFETDDAQEVTGMRQLKDKFIVYKDNSIGVVSGAGTQSWVVQRDFIKGVGCVSGYTVKTGFLMTENGMREVHIFLSQEGFKAFDGVNIFYLPMNPQGTEYKCYEYFDGLAKSLFDYSVAEYYRKRNWYFCFYAKSGSATNDSGAIYDYQTNSLWPITDLNATCTTTRYNTTTLEYEMLVGTDDGRVMIFSETDDSIDDSTELITDGDMEDAGVASWPLIPLVGGSRVKDVVNYLNGAQGLEISSAGSGVGCYQTITTVPGHRYRAYCWVLSTAGAAGAFQFYAYSGTTTLDSDYVTHSAVAWVRAKIEFTAIATTTEIRIEDRRGAGGDMVVDDVTCRGCDIDAYWESKDFDFGTEHEVKILREIVPFATEVGDWNAQFIITYDKSSTTTDDLSLISGAVIWGAELWGEFVWGGGDEISEDLENMLQSAFRTMRIRFGNAYGGQAFCMSKILVSVKPIGRRWFHAY